MALLRILTICLVLAAAAPGAAQSPLEDIQRAQQEAAARRAVALENQLSALDNRLRTEQALSDLQAQRNPPRVPELRYAPAVTPTPGATPKLPSIPDAALADSNRRVREATQPRR